MAVIKFPFPREIFFMFYFLKNGRKLYVYSQFHQIKYGDHPQNILKMMENKEKTLSNSDQYLNFYAYIKSIAFMNGFNSINLRQHLSLMMIFCLHIIR